MFSYFDVERLIEILYFGDRRWWSWKVLFALSAVALSVMVIIFHTAIILSE